MKPGSSLLLETTVHSTGMVIVHADVGRGHLRLEWCASSGTGVRGGSRNLFSDLLTTDDWKQAPSFTFLLHFTRHALPYFLLTLPQSRLSEQFRQPHRQHYNRTAETWRTTLQRRHFARDSAPSPLRTANLPTSPSSVAVASGTFTDSS